MLVRVPEVPVDLYFSNYEQLDEAVRWLWVVLGDVDRALPMSAEDAAKTEEILHRYEGLRRMGSLQAAAARDAGAPTFTLELEVPDGAGSDLSHLLELLDLVNRLVDEEDLALPATPEIRAFRQWIIGEVAAQLGAR